MKQNNKKVNKITITVIIILLLIQCSGNIKKEENKNNNTENNIHNNILKKEENNNNIEDNINNNILKKEENNNNIEDNIHNNILKKEENNNIEDNINNNILKKEENNNNIEDNINNNILKKEENKNNIKENIIKNSIEKINNVVKDSKGKEKKVPKGFENIKDEEETYIKVIIDKKNKGFIKAIIDESKISIVDIDIFKNNNINIEKNKKYKFKFKNENFKFKYVAVNETLIINTIENTNEVKILIDQQKNNFNIHQNLNTNLNKSDEFSYGLGGRLTLNNNDYSVKTLWYKKDNDFFVNDLYLNKEFKKQKIKSGYFNMYSNSNYFSMDNRILGFELNEKSKNMNIIELNIEEESVVTIYRGDNELIYKKVMEEGINRISYSELPVGYYEIKIEIDNGFDKNIIYQIINNELNNGYSISLGKSIEKDKDILFDTKNSLIFKISNNFKIGKINLNPELMYDKIDKFKFSTNINYSIDNYLFNLTHFNSKDKEGLGIYSYYSYEDFNLSAAIDKLNVGSKKYKNYNINANFKINNSASLGFKFLNKKNYYEYIKNQYNENIINPNLDENDIEQYSIYYRDTLYKKDKNNLNYRVLFSKNEIESNIGFQIYYYYGEIDNRFGIQLNHQEETELAYYYNRIINNENGINGFNVQNNQNGTNLNYYNSNSVGDYNVNISNRYSKEFYNMNYRTNLIYSEGDYAIGGNISSENGIIIKVDPMLKEFYYSINNSKKIKVKNKEKLFISLQPNKNYTIQIYATEDNINYEIIEEIRKFYLENGQIKKFTFEIEKSYYLITKFKINGNYLKNKTFNYNGDIIFIDENGKVNMVIKEGTKEIVIDNIQCIIPTNENKNIVFIESIECKENNKNV